MIYVTVPQSPAYHQISLEELLSESYAAPSVYKNTNNTRTVKYEDRVSERLLRRVDVGSLISCLVRFNETTSDLRMKNRRELYHSFLIPKRSGGTRQIDAPNDDLMAAQRVLKAILEKNFRALYHTSAFAYIRGRCTIDAVKRHQKNESKWFAKLDLHNFFGSTTKDFVLSQLSMIFPFNEVMKYPAGREALATAIDLAFLDGVLPQGTPLSPTLTNIMMIPIDFELNKRLRDSEENHFVYTRYADDFIISSRKDFDVKDVEKLVVDTLCSFNAPFSINSKKTRYGSSSGRNWNLGVMLNKENQITIGYKKKRQFQAMAHYYLTERNGDTPWGLDEVQHLSGLCSYYLMVEPETMARVIDHINKTHNCNLKDCFKQDLHQG